MTTPRDEALEQFGDKFAVGGENCFELTLYVSGASDLSARAVANAKQLCDIHLAGRYHLDVVDVHEDTAAVAGSGALATPTLVKNWPLPVRKLVGDLSDIDRALLALELPRPSRSNSPRVGPNVTAARDIGS